VLEELVNLFRNGLFAEVSPKFGRYLFHEQFFWVHFDRNQIRLLRDNTYENWIITRNLSFPSRKCEKLFITCCIIAVGK
jgi:hypothetical protein